VSVLDKRTGAAEISIAASYSSLTCSNETEFVFYIQAMDCGALTDGLGSYFNQRYSHR